MSAFSTPGAVVMISGANRGIGRATAEHLRKKGYRLSLAARDPQTLLKAFGEPDADLFFHDFDAFDPASAERWVAATVAQFGGIDVLINNAGIAETVTIDQEDDDALDRMWGVNVKAPMRMTRLCLPYLEKCGHGRIVNVSSLSGKRAANDNAGYVMSKFALMGLTHVTRRVSWEKGVRVTAMCPSTVRTDMGAQLNVDPDIIIQPETMAELIRTVIELPNNAAIAEMLVNYRREDMF